MHPIAAGIQILNDEVKLAKEEVRGMRAGGVLRGENITKRWDMSRTGGEEG